MINACDPTYGVVPRFDPSGNVKLVSALLDRRANPEVRLLNGCTPLMMAALGTPSLALVPLVR
jgi:hypothetical protein